MSVENWKKLGYSDKQSEELERLSHIGDDMGDIDVHVVDKMLQETMRKYELEKENNIMSNTTNLAGKSLFDTLKEQSEKFNKWVNESEEFLSGISTENTDKEVSEKIFGKKNVNLGQAIIKESENFSNWLGMSACLLGMLENINKNTNNIKELNESLFDIEKANPSIKSLNECRYVNTIEINLKDADINVSMWEDGVKPIKAIFSIVFSENSTYEVLNEVAKGWDNLDEKFNVTFTIGNMIFLMEDGTFRSVD